MVDIAKKEESYKRAILNVRFYEKIALFGTLFTVTTALTTNSSILPITCLSLTIYCANKRDDQYLIADTIMGYSVNNVSLVNTNGTKALIKQANFNQRILKKRK